MCQGKPYPIPFLGHQNYVYSIAFSPKGNMLVSGSYDEAVFLWDIRSARLMRSLPAHSDPVGGVDFVHDGTLIASCASDGLIRIWDTATGQCLRTLVHEDNASVVSVRFSPNGKYVLAWTLDSCVRLWNYVEGRCVKTYQGHRNDRYSILGAFATLHPPSSSSPRRQHLPSPDPDDDDQHDNSGLAVCPLSASSSSSSSTQSATAMVVSPSEEGSIVIWSVKSKETLQRTAAVHDGAILCVDVHPTKPLFASCGLDGTIRVWRNEAVVEEDVKEEVIKEEDVRGEVVKEEQDEDEYDGKQDEQRPDVVVDTKTNGVVEVTMEDVHGDVHENGDEDERKGKSEGEAARTPLAEDHPKDGDHVIIKEKPDSEVH